MAMVTMSEGGGTDPSTDLDLPVPQEIWPFFRPWPDLRPSPDATVLVVGERPFDLDEIGLIARGGARVALSCADAFRARLERSRVHLFAALQQGVEIYGVTTGFGRACGNRVQVDRATDLGANLLRYHGCGSGEPLGVAEVRAAMVCRLLCFARGWSGVGWPLMEQLVAFLNQGITPVVPSQGSVGASGDLTPMSYIAAALVGERQVFYRGRPMGSAEALRHAGLQPLTLGPKEPLALMNGTPIMTGIAAVVLQQAQAVAEAACAATAMAVHGMAGHAHHFDGAVFEAKPHPGNAAMAERLRTLLRSPAEGEGHAPPESRAADALQDPYSLRCAPHVLGTLVDCLSWARQWVETEANSANDNPLLAPDDGRVLTGGNFYGGHVALAMDALKTALASLADLCDRQMALLVDCRFNRGLPANLVPSSVNADQLHHGFKALQITASALTAEALQGTMPASVFSRSTESHNQDKVSMGTIAARDALRVASITARVVAAGIMVAAQAAELRGHLSTRPALVAWVDFVRRICPPMTIDRPLDGDLANLAAAILEGSYPEVGLS